MFVRATLVAAFAAALLPLTGGTAHASCLDDFSASLDDGHTETPKSEYWGFDYIDYSGTANVTIYGDALLADWGSWLTVDWPSFLLTHAKNAPGATTTFVDCVAG